MDENEFKDFLDKLSTEQIHELIRQLAALNDLDIDRLVALISH